MIVHNNKTAVKKLLTAIDFSLIPPTGKILPVNEISPVMAVFCLIGFFKAKDNKALTIVQPALGPSFGTAPLNKNKKKI